MNFAVKKRELYYDGMKVLEVECGDFRQVTDEFWFPALMVERHLGATDVFPQQYEEAPLYENIYTITNVEVNSPDHESFFRSPVQPGDVVIDGDGSNVIDAQDGEGLVLKDLTVTDGAEGVHAENLEKLVFCDVDVVENAEHGVHTVEVDYDELRGIESNNLRLF